MARALTVYLVAGEASGDQLGGGLMRALKSQAGGEIRFFGVGGEKMQAEGLASLFPYEELSLMGFAEIVPHLLSLLSRVELVVEDILAKRPDIVVTIDSPGFNFRVAEKLRKHGVGDMKLVHYVAPTVWAYKPERAKRCAELFDHMLVLLPFEPPYFEKEGLSCTYVGHPVAWAGNPKGNGATFRTKYQLAGETPLIALLPGSRVNEIRRHMPAFGRAVNMLAEVMSKPAIVVPVPARLLPLVATYFEGCPFRTVLLADETDKRDALAASSIALVKSGTIALEAAMEDVPMVVAYRAHPVSAWVIQRLMTLRTVNLVNILAQKEIIPELLQSLCQPAFIANAAAALLANAALRTRQRETMQSARAKLQPPEPMPPNDIAARVVLSLPAT